MFRLLTWPIMLLSGLEVGINGRDKEPFEFVAFSDANAENDTGQLKIDAWLFPFMNVFALLGKIDGETTMDVLLDGNGMLDTWMSPAADSHPTPSARP